MSRQTVLITAPSLAGNAVDLLRSAGLSPVFTPADCDGDGLLDQALKAQRDNGAVAAAISRTLPFGQPLIQALPDLKIVCKHGAGVDNIDVAAAKAAGVAVARTNGINARSVAEHAIALTFAVARHIVPLARSTAAGAWDRRTWRGEELSGKALGLVGFGRIGREVALIGRVLFGSVAVYDPFADPDAVAAVGARSVDLATVRRQSDILSLHCPLTPETRGLIDGEFFDDMRLGSILINTARGEIINEPALLQAVDNGPLAGAGLDALARETVGPDPLKGHDRIVVTPHIGASTRQALEGVARRAAEIVIDSLAGRPLRPGELV